MSLVRAYLQLNGAADTKEEKEAERMPSSQGGMSPISHTLPSEHSISSASTKRYVFFQGKELENKKILRYHLRCILLEL